MLAGWAKMMGEGGWLADPRFKDDEARGNHAEDISKRMSAWTMQRTTEQALKELEGAKIPAGPLYTPQQALDDAHIRRAGLLVDTEYPGVARRVPLAPTPVDLSATPGRFRSPAPTQVGGFLDVAQRMGAEIVVPLAAGAHPSGYVERRAYEDMCDAIVGGIRRGCDAAFLALHGAMVAEHVDDGEGELLRRIRAVAPRLPIAVGLDFHTQLTSTMVENATVITG